MRDDLESDNSDSEVDNTSNAANYYVNAQTTYRLRACKSCMLLKKDVDFFESGCPNCTNVQMDGDMASIMNHTTVDFDGVIILIDPPASLVASSRNLEDKVAGLYGMNV